MKPISRQLMSAVFMLFSMGAKPQAVTSQLNSDHWSPAQLLERARHLRQLAAEGDGSASETLEKYPRHSTMLAFRSRSGGGELHKHYADLFYILDGHATLLTGGEVADAHTVADGEVRGSAVKGGARQDLKPGDVAHIPAGMAHQMLIADGETVTYFVVKIQEGQ